MNGAEILVDGGLNTVLMEIVQRRSEEDLEMRKRMYDNSGDGDGTQP